jgi:hypothetical protein
VAEQIDADGRMRNVHRLRVKPRLELTLGEAVSNQTEAGAEIRIGEQRGILRAAVGRRGRAGGLRGGAPGQRDEPGQQNGSAQDPGSGHASRHRSPWRAGERLF